jgi:hypothetical protein
MRMIKLDQEVATMDTLMAVIMVTIMVIITVIITVLIILLSGSHLLLSHLPTKIHPVNLLKLPQKIAKLKLMLTPNLMIRTSQMLKLIQDSNSSVAKVVSKDLVAEEEDGNTWLKPS